MARRIVLLSDGTGNSSAKVWRTNVWRVFSALDLTNDDQVACYDDGVGAPDPDALTRSEQEIRESADAERCGGRESRFRRIR
jgi:uncharacterized protein (DUF2235 family)